MAEDEEYQKLKKACDISKKAMDEYKDKMEKGEISGYPAKPAAKEETMQTDENAASIGKEGEFIKKGEGEEGDSLEKGEDSPKSEEKKEETSSEDTISKSEVNDLVKGIETSMAGAIKKGLGQTADLIKSLATATQGILNQNEEFQKGLDTEREANADLKKSLDNTLERLEKVEKTPIPSRTVTSETYKKHPTLEKSEDGGANQLHIKQNRKQILDILDQKAGLDGASPNMAYANAMATFESSGILDKSIISDLQKSEGVDIIG